MLIIGHTAIGLATGLLIPNPVAAFVVGVVSHHAADAIPHFDPGTYLMNRPRQSRRPKDYRLRDWLFIGIDVILTVSLLGWFFPALPVDRWGSIAAGILGANFPDLVHNVPFWSPSLRRFAPIKWWQEKIHWQYQSTVTPRYWYLGTLSQLVVIGLVVWLVFN